MGSLVTGVCRLSTWSLGHTIHCPFLWTQTTQHHLLGSSHHRCVLPLVKTRCSGYRRAYPVNGTIGNPHYIANMCAIWWHCYIMALKIIWGRKEKSLSDVSKLRVGAGDGNQGERRSQFPHLAQNTVSQGEKTWMGFRVPVQFSCKDTISQLSDQRHCKNLWHVSKTCVYTDTWVCTHTVKFGQVYYLYL